MISTHTSRKVAITFTPCGRSFGSYCPWVCMLEYGWTQMNENHADLLINPIFEPPGAFRGVEEAFIEKTMCIILWNKSC